MQYLEHQVIVNRILYFSAFAQSGGDSQSTNEKMKQFGKQLRMLFLYVPEQPFPKTPADYGFVYEDVEFQAFDQGLKSKHKISPDLSPRKTL